MDLPPFTFGACLAVNTAAGLSKKATVAGMPKGVAAVSAVVLDESWWGAGS